MSDTPSSQGIPTDIVQKIVKTFEERGVNRPCPRCGHPNFIIVVEGYATYVIQPPDLSRVVIEGQHLPAVITTCQKCGFVSVHSLITLGLLPTKGEKKQ